MEINNNGEYVTHEKEIDNIDYYISEFCAFKSLLSSLLRKDPETRQAIINARYKDLLCLRVQADEIHRRMHDVIGRAVFEADSYEAAAAAGEHPDTYGDD